MSEKQQIIIDLSRLRTKKGVHNRFREALNFPVYYGMNLDALHDCLMEQRVSTFACGDWTAWSGASASGDRP